MAAAVSSTLFAAAPMSGTQTLLKNNYAAAESSDTVTSTIAGSDSFALLLSEYNIEATKTVRIQCCGTGTPDSWTVEPSDVIRLDTTGTMATGLKEGTAVITYVKNGAESKATVNVTEGDEIVGHCKVCGKALRQEDYFYAASGASSCFDCYPLIDNCFPKGTATVTDTVKEILNENGIMYIVFENSGKYSIGTKDYIKRFNDKLGHELKVGETIEMCYYYEDLPVMEGSQYTRDTHNVVLCKSIKTVAAPEEKNADDRTYILNVTSYPSKTRYTIGEELDLSGGYAYGIVTSSTLMGDTFTQPFDSKYFTIDSSEFDNTKPGTYNIYIMYGEGSAADWDSYQVTVCDAEATEVTTETTTTTTPLSSVTVEVSTTTTTAEEPEIWRWGTGVDHFDSVETLPTKTVYTEGEEFDFSGLVIKAHHSAMKYSNKGNAKNVITNYVWEPVKIDPKYITVISESGKTYSISDFSKLKGGSYIISIGSGKVITLNVKDDEYEKTLYDTNDFSFKVYVSAKDSRDAETTEVTTETTTTTTPLSSVTTEVPTTTTTAEEPEIWRWGTGVDHFDSIETLPTKIVYTEGEEFDFSGLVIKAHHSAMKYSNKGNAKNVITNYVWEPVKIDPKYITVISESGETYNISDFSKLKGGESYIISIGSGKTIALNVKDDEYEKTLYDTNDFSYKVYISAKDSDNKFIEIKDEVAESFSYGSGNNGFKLRNRKGFSVDMDSISAKVGYDFDYHILKDDIVSGVLLVNTKTNYLVAGDLRIVKYSGKKGDANCDGSIDLADAILIMQALANPDKYSLDGTEQHHLTTRGHLFADIDGNGMTADDALEIQLFLLGKSSMIEK